MSEYSFPDTADDPLLRDFCCAAEEAGRILLGYWRTAQEVTLKEDKSPVTIADIEADRCIIAALKKLLPDVPVVSEEGLQGAVRPDAKFLLVDPLDGTKSFIRGGRNFTVNIALIENRRAIAGVVLLPAQNAMYAGSARAGAWRIGKGKVAEKITTRALPASGYTAIVSHSHLSPATQAFLEKLSVSEHSSAASSLKFCKVAEGSADVYPRFGPTMEWDTAAGQAVLEAAGGRVTLPDGTPFLYGKASFANGDFIAWGR